MSAFVELVPPQVLRVFTLSELHVALAAERKWVRTLVLETFDLSLSLIKPVLQVTLQHVFLDLPDRFLVSNDTLSLPSHTNEELLDELMLKITGFRLETCQYIQELS